MSLRVTVPFDPYLIGNGRWCSCCFPGGPPVVFIRRRSRRGCNECAGQGRIVLTAEEIVARTIAEARAHRERAPR